MNAPVFYHESINKHAPAVLSCLARIVNELLLLQAQGVQLPVALKVEQGNAVALIMRATAPPECPVLTPDAGKRTVGSRSETTVPISDADNPGQVK